MKITRNAEVKTPSFVAAEVPVETVARPSLAPRVAVTVFSDVKSADSRPLTGASATHTPVPQRDPFGGQVMVTRDYDPHHLGIIDGNFLATKSEVLSAPPTPAQVWSAIQGAEQSYESGERLMFEPFPGSVVGHLHDSDRRSMLEKVEHALLGSPSEVVLAEQLQGVVTEGTVLFHVARSTVRAFPPLSGEQQRAFMAHPELLKELAALSREHGVFSFTATRGEGGALQVSTPQ